MERFDAEIIITAADHASKVFEKIAGSSSGLVGRLNRAGAALMKFGTITTGLVTAPIVAEAYRATEAFRAFDNQSQELHKRFLELNDQDFARMTKNLRAIPRYLPKTLDEVMKVAEIGAQLGVGAEDLQWFTDAVTRFSIATTMPMEEAAQAMANVEKAFKMDPRATAEFADTVAYVGLQFHDSIPDVLRFVDAGGAMAHTFGIDPKKYAVFGAALMSTGKSAGEAAATMEFFLKHILAPATKKGGGLAAAADAAHMTQKEFRALANTDMNAAMMRVLEGVAKLGSTSKQQEALTRMFGARGAANLLPLVKQYEEILRLQNAVESGMDAGTMSALTEQQLKDFDSKLQVFKNKWHDLEVTAGSAILPALDPRLDQLMQFMDRWTQGPEGEAHVKWAVDIALFMAAVGPAVLIAGGLLRTLGTLTKTMQVLGGAMGFVGLKGVLAGGALAFLAGVAAYSVWQKWDEISASLNSAADAAGRAATNFGNMAEDLLSGKWDSAAKHFSQVAADVARSAKGIDTAMVTTTDQILKNLHLKWLADFLDYMDETKKEHFYDQRFRSRGYAYQPNAVDPRLNGPIRQLWETWSKPGVLQKTLGDTFDWLKSKVPRPPERRSYVPAAPPPGMTYRDALKRQEIYIPPARRELPTFESLQAWVARGGVTAKLDGQATVNVRIQVEGPGRVTGITSTSSGDIKTRVGYDNTGAPPPGWAGR